MKVKFAIIVFSSWLLYITETFAQPEIKLIETAWLEERFVDVQKALPSVAEKYPKHPTVLFLQAFFQNEGEKAIALYSQLYQGGMESPFAEAALFRLAQYQYAKDHPATARRLFSFLVKRYPKSKWADDAYYLTAQCYLAEGKLDSARAVWKQFVREHPHSSFADVAVADLESDFWKSEPKPQDKPVMPQDRLDRDYWAIQVGAFAVRENAVSILKGLQEVGYQGEIVEKQVGNRVFHAVWIGQFKDRASAEAYAQRFIIKLTKDYQIVHKQ